MRIQHGMSNEEVIEQLSPKQKSSIDRMKKAQDVKRDKEAEYANRARLSVLAAIEAGVPVRIVAKTLGRSLARVYQMRDEALLLRESAKEAKEAQKVNA